LLDDTVAGALGGHGRHVLSGVDCVGGVTLLL
jgi:hypothetical protein